MPLSSPRDPPSRGIPTVVISLDLELAWGSFDVAYGPDLLARARWTPDVGVPLLLSLLSSHGLSATWAVVGLMMEDRLPAVEQLEEMSYPHFARSWFEYVPRGAGESEAPEWFGRSLVQRIRETRPGQEIGFHSYSHVVFGHPGTPRGRVHMELLSCRALAERLGFDGTAFVFPRNSVGYLDELKFAGFRCYRSPDCLPAWAPVFIKRKIAMVLADFLALGPPRVRPRIHQGLVEIPGSLMFRYAGGWRKYIPDACRSLRLRKGLKRVLDEGGVFHLWFHPENLYEGRPRLERVLKGFFDELGDAVGEGRIRSLTMGQLAEEMLVAGGAAYP